MNSTKYGTSFLETEAFLAILNEDTEYAAEKLRGMSHTELRNLYEDVNELRWLIHDIQVRTKKGSTE